MSYNLFQLPLVGHVATGSAGVTVVSLALNPGPLTRVYLYADLRHTDATDRILSIILLSLSGSGNVVITDSQTITSPPLTSDRVVLTRPIIVQSGERLRGLTDGLATAAQLFIAGIYVEVPASQAIEGFF